MDEQFGLIGAAYFPPREWFDSWTDPSELAERVIAHNRRVPEDLFFNDPKLKPLHEAYVASVYGHVRNEGRPCEIRLGGAAQRFPDFELRVDGQALQFEVTEADRPNRRRGKEYREVAARRNAGLPNELEMFSLDEEERAALPAISLALKRKAQKRYAPPPHLLVYVNFGLYAPLPLTKNEAAGLVWPWRKAFASVWLLWGANVVRCWPNPAKIVARAMPRGLVD